MLNMIEEAIRWLLWGIDFALLSLMDVAYDTMVRVASIDFLALSNMWDIWSKFMAFLAVIVVWRLVIIYIRFSTNEEFESKFSPSQLIKKLFVVGVLVAVAPIFLKYSAQVSVWAVSEVNFFVGGSDTVPSTTLISAYMNEENGAWNTETGEWVPNEQVSYTLNDVEINAEDPADTDKFKFFPTIGDLFIVSILAVACSALLMLIAFQVAQRTYAIAIKVALAVFPIASMIDPDNDTFGVWVKMLFSDFVMNFVQVFIVMLVLVFSSSKVVTSQGIWAQIISMIGGFFLCLRGVPELAKLFGGETGSGGVLQQLSHFRQATRGMMSSIGKGASAIGNAATGIAAPAVYGAGRAMGGISKDEFSKQQANNDRLEKGFTSNHSEPQSNENVTNSQNLSSNGGSGFVEKENNTSQANQAQPDSTVKGEGFGSQKSEFESGYNPNQKGFNLAKEGSKADKLAERGNMPGLSSMPARLISNVGGSMYKRSMERMNSRGSTPFHRNPNRNGGSNNNE